jgi:hypothetical protein
MLDILKNKTTSPSELIAALKTVPGLAAIYETRVRHYILETHTKLVLGQFDQYFKEVLIPIPREIFRFLLTVHDIGKPQAYKEGNLANQYTHTARLINGMRDQLPFKPQAIDFCLAVIHGDPLGQYMQNKASLISTQSAILEMAGQTVVPVTTFFKVLTIYYQCDIAAYTADAGGIRYLERLFLYKDGLKCINETKGILIFSPIFEFKYLELENAIE